MVYCDITHLFSGNCKFGVWFSLEKKNSNNQNSSDDVVFTGMWTKAACDEWAAVPQCFIYNPLLWHIFPFIKTSQLLWCGYYTWIFWFIVWAAHKRRRPRLEGPLEESGDASSRNKTHTHTLFLQSSVMCVWSVVLRLPLLCCVLLRNMCIRVPCLYSNMLWLRAEPGNWDSFLLRSMLLLPRASQSSRLSEARSVARLERFFSTPGLHRRLHIKHINFSF